MDIKRGSAADWATQIRTFRCTHFVKQAALAHAVGVDQATISRWERGASIPDLKYQMQLQNLMRRACPDAFLAKHAATTSLAAVILSTVDRIVVAGSESYHRGHGFQPGALVGRSTRPTHTEDSERLWRHVYDAGFYKGDVASVNLVTRINTYSGLRRSAPVKGVWFPIRVSDGQILLRGEKIELTEQQYTQELTRNGGAIRLVTIDDLVR